MLVRHGTAGRAAHGTRGRDHHVLRLARARGAALRAGRDHLVGAGARGENLGHAGGLECLHVLVGDDATDDDRDVGASFTNLVDHGRRQRHVGAGQEGESDRVDVLVDCCGRHRVGGLEEAGVDDLVARVTQDASHHLHPAVVAVQAHLRDEHTLSCHQKPPSSSVQGRLEGPGEPSTPITDLRSRRSRDRSCARGDPLRPSATASGVERRAAP